MAATGPSAKKTTAAKPATEQKQSAQQTVAEPISQGETAMQHAMNEASRIANLQSQTTNQSQQSVKGTATMSNQYNNTHFSNTGLGLMENFKPRFSVSEPGDSDAAVLMETVRAIQKSAEGNPAAQNVGYVTIGKGLTGNFTAVVVTVSVVVDNQLTVGTHALIMEASRPPLDTLTQPGQNGTIEVIVSPAEAYTPDFAALVSKEVQRVHPTGVITECGYQVIHRETVLTDPNTVAAILNEATQAIDTALRNVDARESVVRFNLEKIVKQPSIRVQSKITLDAETVLPTGLPVRSDITAELIMQQSSGKQQAIQSNTTMQLASCTAYTDLLYMAPAQLYGNAVNFNQQQQYHYAPRITITGLTTGMAGSPLEFALLAIANMTSLNRNRAYAVQFRDTYNLANKGSLRNLGAIGWQMPQLGDGQPGALQIESQQQLQQLIYTAIDPRPVYTLEVEQAGHNGWLLEVFSNAAEGDVTCNAEVINAVDNLTGGRFRTIYASTLGVPVEAVATQPVIRATRDLNHIGYFKDPETGLPADIRKLDLVAILNIANGNDELVRDYLSTIVTTTGEHPLQRLDRRLRIFRNLCSDVTIKGYTTKYDFTAAFIHSLIKAIEATGFVLNATNTLLSSQEQVYTQTVQDWSAVMVDPSIGSGLYQSNTFQPQGNIYNVGQNRGYGW